MKEKKSKLVRDSFTIPKDEYAAIDALKARAMPLGIAIKKSELLRAGLMALAAMSEARFKAALLAVPTLKTGRPSSKVESEAAPENQQLVAQAAAAAPDAAAEPAVAAVEPAKPARKARAKTAPAAAE
jgi:hypothetical protein